MNVLITHPCFGSIWLSDAEIKDGYVIGNADDYQSGSNLPDPQPINFKSPMNFPVSCIKKIGDD